MQKLTLTLGQSTDLRDYPARVGALHFPAGTVLPPTSHEQDEISFIHSGVLKVVCGGQEVTLRGGDVSFIPAGEIHSAEVLEDVALSYVLVEGSREAVRGTR